MKKFLITTSSLLVISLLIVVAVFWYLMSILPTTQKTETNSVVRKEADQVKEDGSIDKLILESEMEIPLSILPLNDTQKKMLVAVGVDVETFAITPPIYRCFEDKLGTERVAAIKKGEIPRKTELVKVLPCLEVK